jgi:hypothetical protein
MTGLNAVAKNHCFTDRLYISARSGTEYFAGIICLKEDPREQDRKGMRIITVSSITVQADTAAAGAADFNL